MKYIKGLALATCLAVFLASCGKAGPPIVGNPAPAFVLNLLDGGQLGLTELRGKPLMLYFFASWWWRCKDEVPLVQGAGKKYKARGLQVIGIGIQDKKAKIADYVRENKLEWPVGFDDGDKIAKNYGITFGAGTVFIDRNGIVQGRFLGGFGEEELELEIEKILR